MAKRQSAFDVLVAAKKGKQEKKNSKSQDKLVATMVDGELDAMKSWLKFKELLDTAKSGMDDAANTLRPKAISLLNQGCRDAKKLYSSIVLQSKDLKTRIKMVRMKKWSYIEDAVILEKEFGPDYDKYFRTSHQISLSEDITEAERDAILAAAFQAVKKVSSAERATMVFDLVTNVVPTERLDTDRILDSKVEAKVESLKKQGILRPQTEHFQK